MPIATGSAGSSYFYPVAQVPVSSYKTVVIRGIGSPPSTAAGAGHLYILSSSNDLYYKDADGNEIVLGSGGGSGENVFDNVYVSSSLLVKGDSVLSGNVVVGGQLYDLNSNLILSSSVGSIIAASGSIDFPNTDKNYHIRAVNSHLILSSSAGSIIIISGSQIKLPADGATLQMGPNASWVTSGGSTTLTSAGNGAFTLVENSAGGGGIVLRANFYKIANRANTVDFLTITSSLGNASVAISGGVSFVKDALAYDITSNKGHLILSSSVGSVVAMSASHDLVNVDKTYHIRAVNGNLILSSSAGSIVALSSNLYFPVDAPSVSAHIVANNSHLILSSSVGSKVRISGTVSIGETAGSNDTITISHNGTSGFIVGDSGAMFIRAAGVHVDQTGNGTGLLNVTKAVYSSLGSLILSSSSNSTVALSASQDFTETDKAYHVRSVNSHLILSSTLGSIVALSSNLYFPVDAPDQSAHITARNSHLILSSSVGSTVTISGNLQTSNATGPLLFDRASTSTVPTLIPRVSLTASGIGADAAGVVSIISNATEAIRVHNTAVNTQVNSHNVWGSFNCLNATGTNGIGNPRLIGGATVATATVPNIVPRTEHATTGIGSAGIGKISLIAASKEALRVEESGSSVMILGTGSLIISGSTAGQTTISSQESHLILSSSAGSVVKVSGNLDIGEKLTKYNGVTTAGIGLSPYVAYGHVSSSTSQVQIVSYTPTADGLYEIGSFHELSAYTNGNVSVNWAYTSSLGTVCDFYAWGSDFNGGAESNHIAATGDVRAMNTLTIGVKANRPIEAHTFLSLEATGSFYAWIRQVA